MADTKPRREEDRRIKRTKKLLRDSLLRLLEEKPITKISVKELTEMADVNRSTFYFYYKDVVDMVENIQDEIFEVFEQEVLTQDVVLNELDDFRNYIAGFLKFIYNNDEICRFAVSNDVENSLSNRIKQALIERLPDSKKVFHETDPRYYITAYGMYGVWQTIVDWMYDGMLVPVDEFADFLATAYFLGGRAALKRD